MADINVERKSPGVWPWIIGLIVLALLIWALVAALGGDEEAEMAAIDPVATEVQPAMPIETAEPVAEAPGIVVSEIIASPATWIGRSVGGEVRVADVPTDRGFWIEDQGERLLVILRDAPQEQPIDINPGQTIRMREAVVYDDVSGIPGEIDADTRALVESVPVFLGVDEANVEILQPGA